MDRVKAEIIRLEKRLQELRALVELEARLFTEEPPKVKKHVPGKKLVGHRVQCKRAGCANMFIQYRSDHLYCGPKCSYHSRRAGNLIYPARGKWAKEAAVANAS